MRSDISREPLQIGGEESLTHEDTSRTTRRPRLQDQGRSLVLDLGWATLEVFDEKQAEMVDRLEVGRRVSGQVRFALQVPDLDAGMARLQQHGAKLVHSPVTTPWGDRTARFEDPKGMQITPFQAPSP